ncbi:MAG: histidinol dehydrogenase, partial [Bacteroidetes bacterium]
MKIIKNPPKNEWNAIFSRPVQNFVEIEQKVAPILAEVRQNGDFALQKFSLQFDKVKLENLKVSESEIVNAEKQLSDELKTAIQVAKQNITHFHSLQKENFTPTETMSGVLCWRKSVAIQKVGIYIPSGTAPLFSTVLMLGIPAQIAGCQEVVMCSPPDKNGNIHPAILYAAQLVGVHQIFKIGGSQAIAAMAYGTETVPKVYKIFGPGNQYVTTAKQLVSKEGMAIDMPA